MDIDIYGNVYSIKQTVSGIMDALWLKMSDV